MTSPILELDRVSRAFGGLIAVSGVSVALRSGEMVGLVGPNGAGKSTTFNLACGYLAPNEGTVRLRGADIAGMHPSVLARGGLGRTFQTPVAFDDLTVIDNVLVGAPLDRPLWRSLTGRWRSDETKNRHRAEALLERIELGARANDHAGDLSGGETRMLEVARQLMGSPDLLMLDEPTAGVAPRLQARLADLIRSVHADGTALLIVEHNLGFLLGLVDRVICMAGGEIIADGSPDEIRRDPTVIAAYLGEHGDVA
jgi:ABC-type branched-subunit amino acid transport system ATPase component